MKDKNGKIVMIQSYKTMIKGKIAEAMEKDPEFKEKVLKMAEQKKKQNINK